MQIAHCILAKKVYIADSVSRESGERWSNVSQTWEKNVIELKRSDLVNFDQSIVSM